MPLQRIWLRILALSSVVWTIGSWQSVRAEMPQPELSQPPLQGERLPRSMIDSPPQSSPASPPQSPPQSIQSSPSADAIAAMTSEYVTYSSAVLGSQRTYGLVLPPGYNQDLQQHYPVIVLLHGGSGHATDWLEKGDALATLQQLYREGKLPPSIVIMPDGNDKRGSSPYWDPQYIDGANGNLSTAIGDELVKLVQSRYRTLPPPAFWAIGGLSSGAWGAVNIGLHHLDHFSVLFAHSGYFVDSSGAENSPLMYIKTLPASQLKLLHIYLDAGLSDSDKEVLTPTREFHQMLDQLGISNVFNEFSGSHSWSYWRSHLVDSLTYVGEQFQIAHIAYAANNPRSSGKP
jgi:enterochelin esterase-like enzyme